MALEEDVVSEDSQEERNELKTVVSDLFDVATEDPSDDLTLNLLVGIRQEVDLLNALGVFDDDESPIGKLFGKGSYDAIRLGLEEDIGLMRGYSSSMAYARAPPLREADWFNEELERP